MNAGAYGREMKDIVQSVKCVDYNGEEKEFSNSELAFSYRNSIFKKEKYIITEVTMNLQKGKKEEKRRSVIPVPRCRFSSPADKKAEGRKKAGQ